LVRSRLWAIRHQLFALKRIKGPLWASGILLYLPTHRASEHRYLLLRGPVFLFDVTCVYRKLKLGRSGGEVRQIAAEVVRAGPAADSDEVARV
jgi:hypothetical protein